MATTAWNDILASCPLARGFGKPGVCDWCAKPLRGRQQRWCSRLCSGAYDINHVWSSASIAAKRRDGERCVLCGAGPDDFERVFHAALSVRYPNGVVDDRLHRRTPWAKRIKLDLSLEVDHLVPREGQGYGPGCWHHLELIRTCCHKCHNQVTQMQRAARRNQPLTA